MSHDSFKGEKWQVSVGSAVGYRTIGFALFFRHSVVLSFLNLSDENILDTLWAQLLLQFQCNILKLCRCFLHGMKMCMCGCHDIILWLFFSHFCCFVNSLFFLHEMLSKCIDSGEHCGCNFPYSFLLIILKLCRCFLHAMKMCMWFWYNTCTLIISSYFFCFVNLVSF